MKGKLSLRQRGGLIGTSGLLGLSLLVSACGTGSSAGAKSASRVNLILWQNLGNGSQAQVVPVLIKAFEKSHPNVTVTNVEQPRANYFALLQTAAVARSGPDLVNMWTGLFTMQYKSYLEPLSSYVPKTDLSRLSGLQWSNVGFKNTSDPYVIPLQQQFYIGFYNKALFRKAGISSAPQDWHQLFADCKLLKATGATCIEEGTQNLSGEFYPWYSLSYLMAGVFSPAQWEGLYNGSIKWTNPTVVAQLKEWHKLYADGYINSNALTATNVQSNFLTGKAAMIIKGNWDTSQFSSTLGSNVAAFVPPFSTTPMHKVVEFAGNGFAMTSYSPHKQAAAEFLRFMTSSQAGSIVAHSGLIPAVRGIGPTNSLASQMVSMVNKGYTVYPMLDNVTAPGVVTAGSSVLPDMLVGGISPQSAAGKLESAWQQLPTSERGSSWSSYQVP
jgi:ABC-type glycerol-3-phosphate transport system substrate-binding protein